MELSRRWSSISLNAEAPELMFVTLRGRAVYGVLLMASVTVATTVLTFAVAAIMLIAGAVIAAVVVLARGMVSWSCGHAPMLATPGPPAIIETTLAPRVPAEYESVYTYLERRYASTVVLTFEQIEALLGFALPEPAWTERGWWTSAAASSDRHADAWMLARRSATPNLSARTVTFERVS
jgi:hypothetical protein